jgi:hypothetical protein
MLEMVRNVPEELADSILREEEEGSTTYQTTGYHGPEHHNMNFHSCQNTKHHIIIVFLGIIHRPVYI